MNHRAVQLLKEFLLKFFFPQKIPICQNQSLVGGARGREEGKFSLEVFTFPQKTVKFEMFQVDIFASRNFCYSGMCVSSVKLYTVKKRHKNV